MKLNLVVKAAGKLEGKVLPIALSQFVIGRDPQCQLRPASPMISKRHCAIVQRDGKAFIRDFGSTNGTFVNEQPVKDEAELHNGDQLKVGPLLFQVQFVQDAPAPKGATPKPPTKPVTEAKGPAKPQPAKAPVAPAKTMAELAAAGASEDDDIASMLLSLNDDDASPSAASDGGVPEGSTVMDLMVPKEGGEPSKAGEPGKDKSKDKVKASGNTSNAAKSILEQYMKRPRG